MPETPVLDEWFGPKEKQEGEIVLRQYKHDWSCEDRLKGALDAFCDAYWEPYGKTAAKALIVSARQLMEEVPEAEIEDFIAWSVAEVRKRDNLDVKSMRSLVFLVPAWRKKHKRVDYSDGWFDD